MGQFILICQTCSFEPNKNIGSLLLSDAMNRCSTLCRTDSYYSLNRFFYTVWMVLVFAILDILLAKIKKDKVIFLYIGDALLENQRKLLYSLYHMFTLANHFNILEVN
jgi:hypothetical protein